MRPLISLIIPTHLRPTLLGRALESINKQFLRDAIEVIVVSDVKDVETSKTCHKFLKNQDIYLNRNGRPGPSDSRNLGLKMAKGQFIMFLDDDDAWTHDFTLNLQSHLNHIGAYITYFDCTVVKESRNLEATITHSEKNLNWLSKIDDGIYVKNQIHMSCLLFPEHAVKSIFFDSTMRAYEDWDFILAAYKMSAFQHMAICCSRIHEVDDETTDRRGSSKQALDFNAVLDYLYVYRRHPAPSHAIAANRQALLSSVGLTLPVTMF